MEGYKVVERTNYFKVIDVDALKSIVERIDGAELFENTKGEFAIAGNCEIESVYIPSNDTYEDIATVIQPILAEGEAVIFMLIGNKGLKSIKAESRVITKEKDILMSLADVTIEMARKTLKDNNKTFMLEF